MSRRIHESRWVGLGRLALAAFAVGTCLRPARAPATVQEQRARLPPPAECADPVAGKWKSHAYDDTYGEWSIFTLDIRRVDGSDEALVGAITNESWRGSAEQSQPGPCRGLDHLRIGMDARGTITGGQIAFTAYGQWRLEATLCGEFSGLYNLDSFTGRIDPDLLEFQSVNNDGGRAVNHPTVFRRIACADGDAPVDTRIGEPTANVAPPPLYPPEDEPAVGCACTVAAPREDDASAD
jgi:hypothetical protein